MLESNECLIRDSKLLKVVLESKSFALNLVEQKSDYEKSLKALESFKKPFTKIPINKMMTSLLECGKLEKNLYSISEAVRTFEFPIFFLDDVIAYSAILQFYTGKHQIALESLITLEKMLSVHKKNYTSFEDSDERTSLNTYGLKFSVMALNECYYNILLCHLVLKNFKVALKVVNELLITLKPQAAFWIVLIRFMIQHALGQVQRGDKDMEALKKIKQDEINLEDFMEKKWVKIEFDYTKDRLIESFSHIEIPIGNYKIVIFI